MPRTVTFLTWHGTLIGPRGVFRERHSFRVYAASERIEPRMPRVLVLVNEVRYPLIREANDARAMSGS